MNLNIILFAVILIKEATHLFERRDLYNRIMCGDIKEYRSRSMKKKNTVSGRHEEVIKNWRDGNV